MKQKATKIILLSLTLLLVAMPAYADFVFCGGKGDVPCKFSDLFKLVFIVVNYLISMAGLVAILFIVWGGFRMLTSAGDPARIKDAKSTIWNAILGMIIVLLSYIIVGYVAGILAPDAGGNPLYQLVCGYLTCP